MIKVPELTGALLDYWVAKAEDLEVSPPPVVEVKGRDGVWRAYKPSTFWSDSGPLIEKHSITVDATFSLWAADIGDISESGDTPLQAICRAVVRAAFGDEVEEVPCA